MQKTSRLPLGRVQLQQVLAVSGDVVQISDVTKALDVSRTEAAKRLARWREQGWLSRVGSGAYVPASIDTLGSVRVLDDGWIWSRLFLNQPMLAAVPQQSIGI